MTRTITYSLCAGERNSDAYHRAVGEFADRWSEGAVAAVGDVIADYRQYRRAATLPERTDAEHAFELLVLGVLLREHGAQAAGTPGWAGRARAWLVRAQERWPRLESVVKTARGWLGWLARRSRAWRARADDAACLIAWLRSVGDDARADRLAEWQGYFDLVGRPAARRVIARSLALAGQFAEAGESALGRFTENVGSFVSDVAPKHRLRYDFEFITRGRIEYHLGMLGTEILSRAYRLRFLAAPRKVVIVPPCMRAQPEEKCKAVLTPFGSRCAACTPTCRVHQVTRLGEKRGFEVYIIPDELRVFGKGVGEGHLGVVGVSCALTNWSGGWEAESLGVPAQGLLLDYVGCRYHWDENGIPTDTNFKKLIEVVGAHAVPCAGEGV